MIVIIKMGVLINWAMGEVKQTWIVVPNSRWWTPLLMKKIISKEI